MTTRSQPPFEDRGHCAEFEARLPAWLEGQLGDADRAAMELHHEGCIGCAMLVADLDDIVGSAKSLPALTPSRDLWSGIESRLAAPVIPLASRREAGSVAQPARRNGVRVRWFAMAATMLIAVSSGVTWTVARARFSAPPSVQGTGTASGAASAPAIAIASPDSSSAAPSGPAASAGAPAVSAAPALSRRAGGRPATAAPAGGQIPLRATLIRNAGSMSEVDAIYEREIAALRRIVDQRFAELDSTTVAELRRNLETMDQAIEDSRRALERDPRSGLLSTELDRTLEAKLALMRRVALL